MLGTRLIGKRQIHPDKVARTSIGVVLRAILIILWLGTLAIGASERPAAPMTNVWEYPNRIALGSSSTNATAGLDRSVARIQRNPLHWSIESSSERRRLGRSLAVGDFNGDGFVDLFIGLPRGATTRIPGCVVVLRGVEAGGFAPSATTIDGGVSGRQDMFGMVLANAGDVNGDGLSDLVICAPFYPNAALQEGASYIIYGTRTDEALRPTLHYRSGVQRFNFGLAAASAGDVNGDGFADVLAGVPRHPGRSHQEGAAYLFPGSSNGLAPSASWAWHGEQREAHAGHAVAGAGDVNGDGFADVLIGMPDYDGAASDVGRVALFLGSPSGLKKTPDGILEGPHAHGRFGAALAAAGDLNGDGYGDVIIGAPGVGDEVKLNGWVFAYLGTSNGLAQSPAWAVTDHQDGGLFGTAIAALGDIDGDRFTDVIIGAPGFDGPFANQGRVCLFLGRKGGIATTPDWTLEGGRAGAECGDCVAAASDINRDGLNDFLIAASAYMSARTRDGRVDLFLGSRTGYHRQDDFPVDGTNSVRLARQVFSPPVLTVAHAVPVFPYRVIYIGGAVLVVALGGGFFFWRKHTQAALMMARTEERARIARDLHDHVGPHLTRLDKGGLGSFGAAHDTAAGAASSGPSDIARALEQAVWAIDPARDSLESLITFLVEQGESFFVGTGVRCRFELPDFFPERPLPEVVRKNAVPCVQEAFANVLKHSGASEAWLRVMYDAPWLTVWVEDNGRGIPQNQTRRFGNGLKNMKQRAEAMGGQFAIAAGSAGGAQVTLRFKV